MIVIFDVAGPLAIYSLLRSNGMSAVPALLISGALPAVGVAIGGIRHHRLDVVGALVLAGIAVGVVLGLVTHSTRLILAEGSVPTGVIAIAFLGSLWARRPLMLSFALEFIGHDTALGQEMTRLWQYHGYRRVWRVITIVWGIGFLLEAAMRVIIIYNASTGTALLSSKITPFLFVAVLFAWTYGYGAQQRKKGERMGVVGSLATREGNEASLATREGNEASLATREADAAGLAAREGDAAGLATREGTAEAPSFSAENEIARRQ
jgi:hypothetical protein